MNHELCEQGFTFKSPSSILVVGPSNCGKTTFLKRLLLENEDLLATKNSRRIVYCYGSWQPTFDIQKKGRRDVPWRCTYPRTIERMVWGQKRGSLDLGRSHGRRRRRQRYPKSLHSVFASHERHRVLSMLRHVPSRKYAKTISRNAQYIVAFKNPRDQVALCTLFNCIPRLGKTCWSNIMHLRSVPSVIYCWMYILLLQTKEDYWVTYWNTKVVSVATDRERERER